MPLIDENNRVGGIQRDIFAPREESITPENMPENINEYEEQGPIQTAIHDIKDIWDDLGSFWSTLPLSEVGTLIDRDQAVREFGVDTEFVFKLK